MKRTKSTSVNPNQLSVFEILAEESANIKTIVSVAIGAGEMKEIAIPCAASPVVVLSETTVQAEGRADNAMVPSEIVVKGKGRTGNPNEKLTPKQKLERMRVNSPLWSEIEKDIYMHCQYNSRWKHCFEDVYAGAREAFLLYNNRPDGKNYEHAKFARTMAQRAYKKLGYDPLRKQSNSATDELEEYGDNLQLVSLECLQESVGYQAVAPSRPEMDERLEAMLTSSVVPPKYKEIMNLSLQGVTDAIIGSMLGVSRVRVTQMKKELKGIYQAGV